MLAPGATIAGYRIDRLLGQGGMGAVYEATQLSLERTVALKLISNELGDDLEFRERFRREGQLQAAIEHPHIVTVFEAGESEHGLFLAMRLIRGSNLRDLIVGRELDPRDAVTLLSQVADALDTAHESGLIHRDVKPENILVSENRRHAYLADFGVTKAQNRATALTQTGRMMGTLDYISPEQIRGEPASARSDVYSLGAVLYEALTGSVPFPRETDAAVLYAHISDPPPAVSGRRTDLPAALDSVVTLAMAKQPDARYATAGAVLAAASEALGAHARGAEMPPGPIRAPEEAGIRKRRRTPLPRPTAATLALPHSRRGRFAVAGAAAAGLVALAGGGYLAGGATSREEADAPAKGGAAEGSGILLRYPAGWERVPGAAGTVAGVRFRDGFVLRSASRRVRLTAGTTDARRPSFLPRALAPASGVAKRSLVRLGDNSAYLYRGVRTSLTLLVAPRANGASTFACQGSTAARRACERVAGGARLSGNLLDVVPRRPDAARLSATAMAIAAGRRRAVSGLASARGPAAQARVARAAAAAYRKAAGSLASNAFAPVIRPEILTLRKALRSAADEYSALASAADDSNARAYALGRGRLAAAERRLARAFTAFERYGFDVRSS
ncbi:MAG: protein kinase [Gaiellaceae bacterium]